MFAESRIWKAGHRRSGCDGSGTSAGLEGALRDSANGLLTEAAPRCQCWAQGLQYGDCWVAVGRRDGSVGLIALLVAGGGSDGRHG